MKTLFHKVLVALVILFAHSPLCASVPEISSHVQVTFKNQVLIIGGEAQLWFPSYSNNASGAVYKKNIGTYEWDTLCANCGWSARSDHQVLVRNDTLWLMGGMSKNAQGNGVFLNDVWKSADGKNWTLVGNASWSPRSKMGATVWKGRFWISGGYNGTIGAYQDVYSSVDGKNWTKEFDLPSPMMRHNLCVLNSKLTLFGGSGSLFATEALYDIYQSLDGKSWAKTSTVPWTFMSRPMIFNRGGVYIEAGFPGSTDSLLFSKDGLNWEKVQNTDTLFKNFYANSHFSYGASILNDSLYFTGGFSSNRTIYNDRSFYFGSPTVTNLKTPIKSAIWIETRSLRIAKSENIERVLWMNAQGKSQELIPVIKENMFTYEIPQTTQKSYLQILSNGKSLVYPVP